MCICEIQLLLNLSSNMTLSRSLRKKSNGFDCFWKANYNNNRRTVFISDLKDFNGPSTL